MIVMQSEYVICAEENFGSDLSSTMSCQIFNVRKKLCGHFQGHESPSQPLPVIKSSILHVVI